MDKQTMAGDRKAPKSRVRTSHSRSESGRQDAFEMNEKDASDASDTASQSLAYKAYCVQNLCAQASTGVVLKNDWESDGHRLHAEAKNMLAYSALCAEPVPEFLRIRLASTSHKAIGSLIPMLQMLNWMHGALPAGIPVSMPGSTGPVSIHRPVAPAMQVEMVPAVPGFIADCLYKLSEAGRAISDAIAYYDPLKIPISGANAAAVRRQQQKKHNVKIAELEAGLSAANTYVEQLFGLQSHVDMTTMLAAAIRSLDGSPMRATALSSQIQQGYGLYGGHVDEIMSEAASDDIVCQWIAANVFGGDMNVFIAEKTVARDREMSSSIANLHYFVIHENHLNKDLAPARLQQWIWGNVILKDLPIFNYLQGSESAQINALKLHDWEWGLIHAGLLFASRTGTEDVRKVSSSKALELGKTLLALLDQKLVPAQWRTFFKLPATVRYLQRQAGQIHNYDLSKLTEIILDDYFSEYEAQIKKNNPYENYQSLLNQYKTRPQMAAQLLAKECPGLSVDSYLGDIQPFCEVIDRDTPEGQAEEDYIKRYPNQAVVKEIISSGSGVERFVKTIQAGSIDALDTRAGFYLESIDKKFDEQNHEIAEAYGVIDRLLVIDAFSRLADDDSNFFIAAKVKRVTVEFSATALLNRSLAGAHKPARDALTVPLERGVEFFSVNKNTEERIYALRATPGGYNILRVDRARSNFLPFLDTDTRPRQDQNFLLKIYSTSTELKVARQLIDEDFIGEIIGKHQKDFKHYLYEYGYHKSPVQKVRDFLLSMIPFYTCVKSLHDGAWEESAFSCAMDAVSLLPLFGKLLSIGGRFSRTLVNGGMMSMRKAIAESAMRQTFKQTMKGATSDFIRYGAVPAADIMNAKTMASLGATALRAVDPGFELAVRAGQVSMKQVARLGETLNDILPEAAQVFEKMTQSLKNLSPPVPVDRYMFATLDKTESLVPVVRLEGDLFGGRPVYAKIDVETREVFGARYTFSEKGTLKPVPVESSRRMEKLRTPDLMDHNAPGNVPDSLSAPSAISYTESLKNAAFQGRLDGELDALSYDLSSNLFFHQGTDASQRVWFRLAVAADDAVMVRLSNKQANAQVSTKKKKPGKRPDVNDAERLKTLQATGLNMGLTVNSAGRIVARSNPDKWVEIPRQLISLWVGGNAIPDHLIEIINENARVIQQCMTSGMKEFKFKLYVSSDSPTWKNIEARAKLQGVEVIALEQSELFSQFRQTTYHRQYQAALKGNIDMPGGKTHYASAADVLRVYVLNKEGGIYMDVDDLIDTALKNMDFNLEPGQVMLGARFDNPGMGMKEMFGNAIFGTHPNNPIMGELLEEMTRRFEQQPDFYRSWGANANSLDYPKQISSMTGPGIFNDVMGRLPETKQYLAANHFMRTADRDMLFKEHRHPLLQAIQAQAKENPLTRLAKVNLPGSNHSWQHSR